MPQILMSKYPDGTTSISTMDYPPAGTSFDDIDFDRMNKLHKIGTLTFKQFAEGIALYWEKIYDHYFQDIDDFKEHQRQEFKFQNRIIKKERRKSRELRMNRRRSCIQGHGKAGRV